MQTKPPDVAEKKAKGKKASAEGQPAKLTVEQMKASQAKTLKENKGWDVVKQCG